MQNMVVPARSFMGVLMYRISKATFRGVDSYRVEFGTADKDMQSADFAPVVLFEGLGEGETADLDVAKKALQMRLDAEEMKNRVWVPLGDKEIDG
jgi:hypothetical protein